MVSSLVARVYPATTISADAEMGSAGAGEKSRRDTREQLRETCGLCEVLGARGRETAALHGSRAFSKCSRVLGRGFCYREGSASPGIPARCRCPLSGGWEDAL